MEKLFNILLSDNPSKQIKENEEYIFSIIPELKKCVDFDQHSIWHIYDVYNHILHVIDGVDNRIELRLAALFHDIGKPDTFTLDEAGEGHFKGHWIKSKEIFDRFAKENDIDVNLSKYVSKLILHHDVRIEKMSEDEINNLEFINDKGFIKDLYIIKRSDLLAQNPKYHYIIDIYNEQESNFLNKRTIK